MAFSGWPQAALTFYEGLEADNSKSYWTAHKAVYEAAVLTPMTELVEELAADLPGEPKIFRPYRDLRFSTDKTPYKTHIGALVGPHSYVQFSADGLGAGAGMWHLDPERLTRYRAAVAGPAGAELAIVVAAIEKAGIEVRGHDPLKSAPRGYRADHPRIDLLRYKGLTSWQQWTPQPRLATPEGKSLVLAFLRASAPLVDWLAGHVG
jgi:uncharacterized protein (TIGR02453 family)